MPRAKKKAEPEVIDLRDDRDVLDLAEEAAELYVRLRQRGGASERLRGVYELCDALELVRQLQAEQQARVRAGRPRRRVRLLRTR